MRKAESERLRPLLIRTRFSHREIKKNGYVTNLSDGGVFLATEDPIPVGDRLTLRINLPWQIGQITVEAEVVWGNFDSRESAPEHPLGVGLSFVEPSSSAREKIETFVRRFHGLVAQLDDQPS
jgi:uncharacterized protein (TIGR02266 family)